MVPSFAFFSIPAACFAFLGSFRLWRQALRCRLSRVTFSEPSLPGVCRKAEIAEAGIGRLSRSSGGFSDLGGQELGSWLGCLEDGVRPLPDILLGGILRRCSLQFRRELSALEARRLCHVRAKHPGAGLTRSETDLFGSWSEK